MSLANRYFVHFLGPVFLEERSSPVFSFSVHFEVEKQTGRYGEPISSHEAEFKGFERLFYGKETIKEKMEKVRRWKLALAEAADLSGCDLHNR